MADHADTSAACRRYISEPTPAKRPNRDLPHDHAAAELKGRDALGTGELCCGDERPFFRVDFKAPTKDELEAALLELSLVLDELLLALDENGRPFGGPSSAGGSVSEERPSG